MGRKSLAGERRAEIAHGLYRCIAKRGYANTTIRDIADEIDIGLGLITHYFQNKGDILYTMTEEIYVRYREIFLQFSHRHRSKPPRERLQLSIEFIFLKVAADKDLIRVCQELWSLSQHDAYLFKTLKKLYKQYRDFVGELFLEMVPEQDHQDTTIEDLAAFLVAASEGAALLWFMAPRTTSLKRLSALAARLVDTILGERSVATGNDIRAAEK